MCGAQFYAPHAQYSITIDEEIKYLQLFFPTEARQITYDIACFSFV